MRFNKPKEYTKYSYGNPVFSGTRKIIYGCLKDSQRLSPEVLCIRSTYKKMGGLPVVISESKNR